MGDEDENGPIQRFLKPIIFLLQSLPLTLQRSSLLASAGTVQLGSPTWPQEIQSFTSIRSQLFWPSLYKSE